MTVSFDRIFISKLDSYFLKTVLKYRPSSLSFWMKTRKTFHSAHSLDGRSYSPCTFSLVSFGYVTLGRSCPQNAVLNSFRQEISRLYIKYEVKVTSWTMWWTSLAFILTFSATVKGKRFFYIFSFFKINL